MGIEIQRNTPYAALYQNWITELDCLYTPLLIDQRLEILKMFDVLVYCKPNWIKISDIIIKQ